MNQLRAVPADDLRTRALDEDFPRVADGVVDLDDAAHFPRRSLDGVVDNEDRSPTSRFLSVFVHFFLLVSSVM